MERKKHKKLKKTNGHTITAVLPGSIAEELELVPGDILLSLQGREVADVFDYRYLIEDTYLVAEIQKENGEIWELEIEKDYEEDLGISFEEGLMDSYRSCRNQCIFCFIDQNPPGMRETIYFKDDDARLSFLQGNYVTLTNMDDHDVERIIAYHMEPINISVHTTNPELRCMMLHNRFAGEALLKIDRFYEAGLHMNGQIVLCKGINDGKELDATIAKLFSYHPYMQSLSVVPVGLTKYREGLYPLEPFLPEDAREVLKIIHAWQEKAYAASGSHFVHASDEWYLTSGEPFPPEETYDGYPQIENGVGIKVSLCREFEDALEEMSEGDRKEIAFDATCGRKVTVVCGMSARDFMESLCGSAMERFPGLTVQVAAIRNDFFGERITVSGLITGQDLVAQLDGKDLGEAVLLPDCMLKSDEDIFLDDMTLAEVASALQVPVNIVKSDGGELLQTILGCVSFKVEFPGGEA